jgi:hypothetical protein
MTKDVIVFLELTPVYWGDRFPAARILFNEIELYNGTITETLVISRCLPCQDYNRLSIEIYGKTDDDCNLGKDKAIVVSKLGIEGFFYDSFKWAAKYDPMYSEGYYKYASENSLKVEPTISSSYLGFNGLWYLDFPYPVFTWIHELESMGWIHGVNI